jgi:endonuclease YncB( thermonuclease family)
VDICSEKDGMMSTKKCPNCGNEIQANAMRCQNCGSLLVALGKSRERSISRRQALLGGIFILLFPLCCVTAVSARVYRELNPAETESTLDFRAVTESPEGPTEKPEATFTLEATSELATTTTLTPIPIPGSAEASCVPQDSDRESGQVMEVVDGNTILVRLPGGDREVRYIGVNVPSLDEPAGAFAKNANIALVLQKTVTLVKDVSETNATGQLLRYVFVGELFVNYELVKEGNAEAVSLEPDHACNATLSTAEDQAVADHLGMWAVTETPTITLTSQPVATLTSTKEASGGGNGMFDCDCSGPDNLNCVDFFSTQAAQLCYDLCWEDGKGDYYNLDPDGNGKACKP